MPMGVDGMLAGERIPRELRELPRPCRGLYVSGVLPPGTAPRVAVVGSRSPSPSGRRAAYEIAFGLARAGVVVVSGLARGIDAAAHQGALDAGGITVAFLGSGLDVVYPKSSRLLAASIPGRGALVSEYPPGTPPLPFQFVARNRLVAAWTRGTVVVEAGAKSGALITAGLALESGREVWAVPGDPGRASTAGSNRLLRDGAGCVLEAGDVLASLELTARSAASAAGEEACPAGLDPGETRVWRALRSLGIADAEAIARRTGLPAADVFRALSFLELGGHIVREGGGFRAERGP